jgi:hypothetical protein
LPLNERGKMKKPAHLMLHWPEDESGFWRVLIEGLENAECSQLSSGWFGRIRVQDFNMEDHQFIQVRLKRKSGAELVAWIPRGLVIAIVEGKAEMANYSFVSGKK